MAADKPLTGLELVDCAKANAKQGMETAAFLCGYGNDIEIFQDELTQACQQIGVGFQDLNDLITDQQAIQRSQGVEIAPDTSNEL